MTLSARAQRARENAQLRIVSRDPWLSTCPSTDGKRGYIQEWDEAAKEWHCDCPAPDYVECWHRKLVQKALAEQAAMKEALHVV